MQVVQGPVSVQPPQDPTFSDHFLRTRRLILGLAISLIVNYIVILVPLDLAAEFILVYTGQRLAKNQLIRNS